MAVRVERSPYNRLFKSISPSSIREMYPSSFIADLSVSDVLNSLVEDKISKENLQRVWKVVKEVDLENKRLRNLAGFVELDGIVESLGRGPILKIEKIHLKKGPQATLADEVMEDWDGILRLAKRLIILGAFLADDQKIDELYVRKVNKNGIPVKYRVPLNQALTSLQIAVNSYIEESLVADPPSVPSYDTSYF